MLGEILIWLSSKSNLEQYINEQHIARKYKYF
jgi:hypothetical protein